MMSKLQLSLGFVFAACCVSGNNYAGMYTPPPHHIANCTSSLPHMSYGYTPDEEPYGYYVCYQTLEVFQTSYSHDSHRYDRFRYHGCQINTKPCAYDRKRNNTFGWFPTTYLAANALYRCKENN